MTAVIPRDFKFVLKKFHLDGKNYSLLSTPHYLHGKKIGTLSTPRVDTPSNYPHSE